MTYDRSGPMLANPTRSGEQNYPQPSEATRWAGLKKGGTD